MSVQRFTRCAAVLVAATTVLGLVACGSATTPGQEGIAVSNTGSSSDARGGSAYSSNGGTVRGGDAYSSNGGTVRGQDAYSSGGSSSGAADEVKTEQITGAVTKIRVSAEAGRITMVGTDAAEISVTRHIYRAAGEPTETVNRDGNELRIETRCPHGGSDGCRIDYEFQIPRATPVELSTASGNVGITGLIGAQTAISATGNVEVSGARGPVTAKSVSGQILFRDHGAPTTVVSSTTGSVQLQAVTRPDLIQVDSTSGNIAVTVPGGSYRVETSTMTGRKNVSVPSDAGASSVIKMKSVTGNVQVATG
jgi:hypothetical protein